MAGEGCGRGAGEVGGEWGEEGAAGVGASGQRGGGWAGLCRVATCGGGGGVASCEGSVSRAIL